MPFAMLFRSVTTRIRWLALQVALPNAYYGGVPEHIASETLNRLDERLRKVVHQF